MHTPQHLVDALTRHRVDLEQHGATLAADIERLLAVEDARLVALLRSRLPSATSAAKRNALVDAVRTLRRESMAKVHAAIKSSLGALAPVEASLVSRIMTGATGIPGAAIDPARLRRLADTSRTIGSVMRDADARRIVLTLRQGWAAGATADTIVAQIAGSPTVRYADGVLAKTRRAAATETRTAVTTVASGVMEEWGRANAQVVIGWEWDAILDGATCEVCEALDGSFIANDNVPDVPRLGTRWVDTADLADVRMLPGAGTDAVRMGKAQQSLIDGTAPAITVVVNRRGVLEIVDGRHRLLAARALGRRIKVRFERGIDVRPDGKTTDRKPPAHRRCRCGLLPVLDDGARMAA